MYHRTLYGHNLRRVRVRSVRVLPIAVGELHKFELVVHNTVEGLHEFELAVHNVVE